jgi:hypothetical protein
MKKTGTNTRRIVGVVVAAFLALSITAAPASAKSAGAHPDRSSIPSKFDSGWDIP